MSTPSRTVVVGAGLAGTRLAITLRRLAPEREVVLVGEERLDAYERPPLSKEFLLGVRDAAALTLAGADAAALELVGVDERRGLRATRISRDLVELEDGTLIDCDQIVLATGARPRRLPLDADPDRVHVLRSLDDARRLRAALVPGTRLVIVGSGFVGAEVAGSARERGANVTLVEAEQVPFARTLGTDAGTWLVDRWRDAGIDLRLGIGVEAVRDAHADCDAPVRVHLADGELLDADHVLIAIGTIPNDELFHDAFPGAATPGYGVPCDVNGATPIPGIHAVGDVALVHDAVAGTTRRVEHWTDAATGALRLARLLAGAPTGPRPAPYAWSDQFGLRMQVAGEVDPGLVAIVDDVTPETLLVRYVDPTGIVRGVASVGHPDVVARYRSELAA